MTMDSEDRAVADALEDQYMIDRSFAMRVGERFDSIGTTPNRLTMWRIVLSMPISLSYLVSSFYQTPPKLWYWLILGMTTAWMIHEMHNFYREAVHIKVTQARIGLLSLLCGVIVAASTVLSKDELLWCMHMTLGSALYIWAMLLDFFDGALARYQKEHGADPELPEDEEYRLPLSVRLNRRGVSHLGTVLDPLSDKTLYFGVILPLGWDNIEHWLLLGSLIVALLLTLIRFRAIRKILEIGGKSAANRFGKFKILAEVIAVAALGLLPDGPFLTLVANLAVGVALALGGLSLTGHLWLGIKKANLARRRST